MDSSQLYQGLTFLSYSTAIIIILVGLMLLKVMFDFSKLQQNLNETVTIVKNELEPTLKNINKSVEIVSGLIINTNNGLLKVREFFSKTPFKVLGTVSQLTGKATKGFFSGLCSAFKMFSKK